MRFRQHRRVGTREAACGNFRGPTGQDERLPAWRAIQLGEERTRQYGQNFQELYICGLFG